MTDRASKKRIKIVYVGGSGRCGSTLLSLLFSEHPSFFDCGEIKNIWERGIIENRRCACGDEFCKCSFWSQVVRDGFGELSPQEVASFAAEAAAVTRYRHYFKLRQACHDGQRYISEDYLSALGALYGAITDATGDRIIVDSSKLAAYARVLMLLPDVEIFYVNLVRDPRAVVYSWRKKIKYEPGATREMDRFGVLRASLIWKFAYMTAADVMKELPGINIKYEDLAQDTAGTMDKILSAIDAWQGGTLPPVNVGNLTWANTSHSLSGNPLRFRKGEGIQLDAKWKTDFKGLDALVTATLCSSEIRRFGYSD